MEQWREDVLVHYGVKNMRWGHRKKNKMSAQETASRNVENSFKRVASDINQVLSYRDQNKEISPEYAVRRLNNLEKGMNVLNNQYDKLEAINKEKYKNYNKKKENIKRSVRVKAKDLSTSIRNAPGKIKKVISKIGTKRLSEIKQKKRV